MHTTMKDDLSHLFRERFQGHEAPVDPALWQVIEARLLTAAPPSDPVNDHFRQRFEQHEVEPDPAVWENISSKLGQPAAAGSGMLGGYGWVAAGLAGALAIGAVVLALTLGPPDAPVTAEAAADSVEQAEALAQPTANPVERAPEMAMAPILAPKPAANEKTGRQVNPIAQAPAPARTPIEATADPVISTSATLPAGAEEEQVVEHIILELTEQVKQQVAAEEALRQSAGSPATVTATEPEVETAEPAPLPSASRPRLLMPNTFTPNGDGVNDAYKVVADASLSNALIRVYSIQTNQLVFSGNMGGGTGSGEIVLWDGANCADGMYMVAVEATTLDGQVISDGKVVWLNRTPMN